MNQAVSNIYPSKRQISRTFGLKAKKYEQNALVQKELIELIIKRMDAQSGNLWADLGCGTGLLETNLKNLSDRKITTIDISQKSLEVVRSKNLTGVAPVCSDIEKLPLKNNSLNGIVVSSVLQWFPQNLDTVIKSISGLLKNKGTLLFSIFSSECFCELVQIQKMFEIEPPIILPNIKTFSAFLEKSSLTTIEFEEYKKTLYFSSAFELLESLSAIGSTAAKGKRLTRKSLKEFCKKYEEIYGSPKGIPITYHAVTGTAIKEGKNVK
ncbi:MAG: methyltransferase domain-containing protein [Fibrobacter sp.]|nr:methyltransferase domain-containing protein [Fibrobacter sp.]